MVFKFIAISGSLRRGSRNTALLRAVIKLNNSADLHIEEYDISRIPLYNQDLEVVHGEGSDAVTSFPESVAELRNAVQNADGLLLCSPEHNFMMSAAMKNVIDWLSRGQVLAGKVVATMSAAGVTGGQGATSSIEKIMNGLSWLNVRLVSQRIEMKLFDGVPKFNDADELIHEETVGYAKRMLAEMILVK
jgi:chromate reductase, NAD(P)H dehydrogenase (quinone)